MPVDHPKPHSEANPYHKAIYILGLVRAASKIADECPGAFLKQSGLDSLLTVIEERADSLSIDLDAGAFCEHWPALSEWLDRDACLGLGK